MNFTKTKIALAVGVATVLISGVAVSSAQAADSQGSSTLMYALDGETGEYVAPGTVIAWDYAAIGSPSKTDVDAVFTGPADADAIRTFISPRGQESNISAWIANADSAFSPGTLSVLLPNISPSSMFRGQFQNVKDNGGQFSIGFAYVNNNALTIASIAPVFHHITVQPGGNYTFDEATDVAPPAAPSGTADINLSATTIAAADGTLSLVVPAGTTANIGTPTLVNNLSTSTGVLGDITVRDERVISHAGWTLTSTVADFVAGGSTIPASQLLVTPKVVGTAIDGVTAAAAGAATKAGRPFAEAGNGATVGDTVLNADLKFVAPASAAAGIYTSKMTLTLTSK